METELDILAREKNVGVQHDDRIANVEAALGEERERLESLEADWQAEKELVEQILEIRATLRGPSGAEPVEGTGSESEAAADDAAAEESIVQAAGPQLSEDERQKLLADLTELHDQLEALQGERPLILPACDAKAVASVVADWTGIPVGSMVKDEIQQTLELGAHLGKRVVGQQHGLDAIAEVIQISRANLENPNKPIGVFMLAGTSGVGKTETALALAEAFYGGEQSLITINMSEFQESHTVSTLKGAPPGYVGYGEGGILTEAVRRNPYSIVLLDEMEKAHSDVHEIFFQVFDKGMMEDGEGRLINFKNTIIILTTNVGSDLIMNMCKDPEFMPGVEGLQKALREPLLKAFPAALLGRLAVIPYYPLSETMIEMISDLQLKKIQKRIALNHNAEFNWTPEVIDLIKRRCDNPESGGRLIESILTQNVLPSLSRQFLNVMLEGNEIKAVDLGVDNDKFTYAFS
jgi:type VI secretion system protein VasG